MLHIELPEVIEKQLSDVAISTGRTKEDFAREAILDRLDDLEDIALAEQVLKSPGRRYTLQEAKRELDLDD